MYDYENYEDYSDYEYTYTYDYIVYNEDGTESELKDDLKLVGGLTPLHIGCIDCSTEAIKKLLE